MRRRPFLRLAASAGAASAFALKTAHAQPAAGVPRIAILSIPVPASTFDAVAQGLADYGYVEGRNIVTQRFTAPTTPEVPRVRRPGGRKPAGRDSLPRHPADA